MKQTLSLIPGRTLLKRGMGNEEQGTGNGEWGTENGERRTGTGNLEGKSGTSAQR